MIFARLMYVLNNIYELAKNWRLLRYIPLKKICICLSLSFTPLELGPAQLVASPKYQRLVQYHSGKLRSCSCFSIYPNLYVLDGAINIYNFALILLLLEDHSA